MATFLIYLLVIGVASAALVAVLSILLPTIGNIAAFCYKLANFITDTFKKAAY